MSMGLAIFWLCVARDFQGRIGPRPVYAANIPLIECSAERREQEFRRVNTDFRGPIQVSKTGVIDCAYLSQASFTNMGYCRAYEKGPGNPTAE